MEGLVDTLAFALGVGTEPSDLNAWQMAIRAAIIYTLMLLLVRVSNKRFLSRATAFDVIVAIILGSVMSRAINSSAPLVPTLAASAAIMFLHWLFSYLAVNTDWFGPIVKGNRVLLVKDGELQRTAMRASGITQNDLEQAMHLQLNHGDLSRVRRAYLERGGDISLLENEGDPKVVDVTVEDGVQTVRIEVE